MKCPPPAISIETLVRGAFRGRAAMVPVLTMRHPCGIPDYSRVIVLTTIVFCDLRSEFSVDLAGGGKKGKGGKKG